MRINITPKYIKEYIEEITGMDLAAKSRVREVVDVRRVAFKLTKTLTKSSLTSIGKLYNKDHATVLHGIKTFDYLVDHSDFKHIKIMYNRFYGSFIEIQENLGTDGRIETLQELNEIVKNRIGEKNEILEFMRLKYEEKINEITNNNYAIIQELKIQNERLRTNPMFDKICKLPEPEFKDLEVRFNAFFQMNGMNSERKRLRNVV